jgi:PAS domain S-box-containing protein/putative nucleotidyltransferase with HDIG domain
MNPVLDEAGKVKYIVPEGRDITDMVKTQKALKESEEKYRLLIENANEGIFVAQDGLFKFANARVWDISGYSMDELGTRPFGHYIHPEDRDMVLDKYARRLQGEIIEDTYPFRIITKEGKIAWVEVGAIQSEWEGKPAILGFMTDITERKQTEDALRESEEKYRQLVETANEVIFVVQDLKIKFFNRRAIDLTGYSSDELKEMPFAQLVYPDDLAMVADGHQRRLQGEPFERVYPFRYVLKNGAVGWAEINTTLITWEGRPATLSFLSDITERKQAEDALRDSEEQYRAVVENAREGIIVLQGEYIKFVNQYIPVLLGYSKDFLLTHPFLDYIHPDDRLTVIERYMQRLAGEPIMEALTARLLASSGSYVWTEIRAVVIEWEDKPATLNFVTDITESKKAQADLKKAFETITSTLEGTMEAVAMMSELRDPYTAGHQKMVTHLALAIAKEMKLPEDRLRALRVAGLLHDVGKVYVPSEILSKPGKLSELERGLAKAHASAGYDIVKAIKFPWPVDEMVHQHHERMDGSGYPRGLKGDQIMLEARILAVADTVEAMMSHRPYRAALGMDKALDEIIQNRGILYDETVVDTCVLLFREKGFKFPV